MQGRIRKQRMIRFYMIGWLIVCMILGSVGVFQNQRKAFAMTKEQMHETRNVTTGGVLQGEVETTDVSKGETTEANEAVRTTDWETPSGIKGKDLETELDALFDKYIGTSVQGGAVAVVKDGKIVFEKGYGYGNAKNHIPVDPTSTVFEYGSVTKLFTWVSAMQLVEQGKLDLDEPIQTYLPADFKVPQSSKTPITMMNLMNHTAGFDDYWIGLFTRKDNYTDLRTALEEHKVQQINEPGEICSYSNYGAGLAGYLVQCIAGQEEYDYVREQIFEPLQMKQVTMSIVHDDEADLFAKKSKGYEFNEGRLTEGQFTYIPMYPAGEANGTVEELGNFAIGLLDKNSGLFKSPQTYEELFSTTYTANKDIAGVGHGFFEYDGEYKTYWHNGGTNNFSTFFAVVPEEDFAIAVVGNTEGTPCDEMVHQVGWKMVRDKEVNLEEPEANLPSTKEVVGTYVAPRRIHSGITQIIYLLQPYDLKVSYVNEQEIRIDGETYRQIKPYLYQNEEDGQKSYFTVKDGKVVQYTYIQGYQKITQQKGRYIFSYIGIGAWAILFILTLILLVIALFRKKGKRYGMLYILEGIWLVLVCNIVIIASRIIGEDRFGAIQPQLIGNGIFGIVLFLGNILQVVKAVKNHAFIKWEKIWSILYGGISILMLIVLLIWGVFQVAR
ncbi:serine hydrolase [Anaerosporobacter faecicola]|uniref:serine hydrolase n=1 Tax=Anaerosporobacter faecicola TaxID=2718714 RepID=UPI001438882A|nr:serine hydrolase [Anaerosporobacter faecicola]